ncbi:MAG: hypothetical protein COB67_01510 [SAR324 cluster bacterium]|uniref:PII-uridylyltransferase/Glutamine-synthetase adenylyltransferase domain-containing protein n=1 Tax=SAR324 cluster bacterium TaxID=2024889 RepID=A0A2A4TA32_9DELT|nr:MAG: hypothetical protein COB67_01510 [SAR324 cluster bacterium]
MKQPLNLRDLTQKYYSAINANSLLLKQPSKVGPHSQELSTRKLRYKDFFEQQYQDFRRATATSIVSSYDSWKVLKKHTAWIDAWIRFTWDYATLELSLILQDFVEISQQKVSFLASNITQMENRIEELKGYLHSLENEEGTRDPAEYSYYKQSLQDALQKVHQSHKEFNTLQEVLPLIPETELTENNLHKIFLIFARGGYGRAELSFSSDFDIGYCLDIKKASKIEILLAQEIIKRMEELFQDIPLDIASQYFELGEDLSRFAASEMMHTIPSILEGRAIHGATKILANLKQELFEVCTPEKLIRYFQVQMEQIEPEKNNEIFHIKSGYGGLRHLQFALWMALVLYRLPSGNSLYILKYLKAEKVISKSKFDHLCYALAFYNDLRNFLGLYDCFTQQLSQIGAENLTGQIPLKADCLDDRSCMAYLKLMDRFTTVDFMDRSRLHSIHAVASIANRIVKQLLDHTVKQQLSDFVIITHLGSNQINQFEAVNPVANSIWNLQARHSQPEQNQYLLDDDGKHPFFLKLKHLSALFLHIAQKGTQLSDQVKDRFSALIPQLYDQDFSAQTSALKDFIFRLFQAKFTSAAISQMMEISSPLSNQGEIKTLLGVFLPEVNQMRYLLRNVEIHEYPLCIHSLKALQAVEKEAVNFRKKEPELWRFISDEDMFALKWSTFFHDIGKINPYKNHEQFGPVLATKMLLQLGWDKGAESLELIRLLIRHHQSVVRFSHLSTFLDVGILKFFELAQRSPRKVILLYLINLCDFKSVNSTMSRKTGSLEHFFEKTLSILEAFKSDHLRGSITKVVNDYLDNKIEETRVEVLVELLLQQCCNKDLDKTLLEPLSKIAPTEADQIEGQRKELDKFLHFLKLAELDAKTLDNYRLRFKQIIHRIVSKENISTLVLPFCTNWNWFFTTIPNRLLLSSPSEVLGAQLLHFQDYRNKNICFSYIAGNRDEYDTVLFYCLENPQIHAKIAYSLGQLGMNIENGKINKVCYNNQREGVVGFFQVSHGREVKHPTSLELESLVSNLVLPPLTFSQNQVKDETNIQLTTYQETEKGYLIEELEPDQFSRVQRDFVAIKLSLYDEPFCYFKIVKTFEHLKIIPQQITITTIGEQIIDYFYLSPEDQDKIDQTNLQKDLVSHLNAEF